MLRMICCVLNALLGGGIFITVFAVPGIGGPGFREELAFYSIIALLFVAVAVGLFLRTRWLVVVPAIPLFLTSLLLSFLVAAGGWIWGPSNAATASLVIFSGLGLATLECTGIIVARHIDRSPAPPVASPGS